MADTEKQRPGMYRGRKLTVDLRPDGSCFVRWLLTQQQDEAGNWHPLCPPVEYEGPYIGRAKD